jgi:ribA/ribD-fused uncharacterized protein
MTTYNVDWLIKKSQSKENIKYIAFWGHQASKDGKLSKTCFSQWWYASFVVDEVEYKTAEHWMMAEKARLFHDSKIIDKIVNAKTPAEAKKLGRLVNNFDADKWDLHKFEIVIKGNFHKFNQNQNLKEFLINTNDRVIVEASPVDPIWGIGLATDHPYVENPILWKGENLLGFALMEVRDLLK